MLTEGVRVTQWHVLHLGRERLVVPGGSVARTGSLLRNMSFCFLPRLETTRQFSLETCFLFSIVVKVEGVVVAKNDFGSSKVMG